MKNNEPWIELSWPQKQKIRSVQITFDSGLHRRLALSGQDHYYNSQVRGPQPETVADYIIEGEYEVPKVQQAHIEPHVALTYWDEDDRLVIRTSTQVPFHVRRILAPVLGLKDKDIRVIKPRIGGGFGVKQEILVEDIIAHLTLKTGRPVRWEMTREEEFWASRSRHSQTIIMKVGVNRDMTLAAVSMYALADTGAYGSHALTVQGNTGAKGLATYKCPVMEFNSDIVYTNLPPAGAFRGYGAPQGFWAMESIMDEIAAEMDWDPVEFRRKNWVEEGYEFVLAKALGEGREGIANPILTCALPECTEVGLKAIGWERRNDPNWKSPPDQPHIRRGIGLAVTTHGTAIPGLDMGAASIKINDDGSFNLLYGGTDLGTGSDTIIAQIAAETLGCKVEEIIVYAADTDITPFDTGAYASSTTFISGGAVKKAAIGVAKQIKEVAGRMMEADPAVLRLAEGRVWTPQGESVSLAEVALHSLHIEDQRQIMDVASHMSYKSPPPFSAQLAAVEVDIETGQTRVLKIVEAVDCGFAINPQAALAQIDGGAVQSLGYGISEEMIFDDNGRMLNPRLGDYHIFAAHEMPEMENFLVETVDPTGPFGAKAVAEIPTDGIHPALANAIADACGVRIRDLPITPEKVWQALQE
jgi:putative selenate reductase molybdopterin-binding subunit